MASGFFVQCSTGFLSVKPISAVGTVARITTSASRPPEVSRKCFGEISAGTPAFTARRDGIAQNEQRCDEGADMKHHVEREPALVKVEQELGECEVPVARDGKKLGGALDDSQEDGLAERSEHWPA